MQIDQLDHLVLTVADIERTCTFYSSVLGFEVVIFGDGRTVLSFDQQKINLHQADQEFELKALKPTPGSADLCFIAMTSLDDVVLRMKQAGVAIEEGPVERTGASGLIRSIYIRDPDRNLIAIANYISGFGSGQDRRK